jgi:hypothetical protein
MSGLTRDDAKFLFAGILGALLIAVVVFAAYEGWQRAHKKSSSTSGPAPFTEEVRKQIIKDTSAPADAPALPAKIQQQIINSTTAPAPSAGTSAGAGAGTSANGGLTPQEQQQLIDATSAH